MISLDSLQLQIASRATAQMVTLVKLDTFSDYTAETIDETFYFSSVPVRYQWDGSTTVQFRGPLKSVSPISRGFDHIPDSGVISTRDGMRIQFDASQWADEFPWVRLTSKNLLGAKVEVASLLVEWDSPLPDDWADLSAMGAVHTVRFRGELTDVPDYDDEGNEFELVFDSIEPVLSWPVALDPLEVSAKDTGKTYAIPVGNAKRVALVQRKVGWFTTLATAMTDLTLGAVTVTDTTGFPDDPTVINLFIGTEKMTALKVDATTLMINTRAESSGGITTNEQFHNAGALIVEEIEVARFVYAGIDTLGLTSLYARSPQSGELVFIPKDNYGAIQSDQSLDAGLSLGVVSFTRELWAGLIQTLNNEAKISTQAVFTQSSNIRSEVAAEVGRVVPAFSFQTHGEVDPPTGNSFFMESDFNPFFGGEAGAFYWLNSDILNETQVVERFRIIIDYTFKAINTGNNATIYAHGGFMGLPADTQIHNCFLAGDTDPTEGRSEISAWIDVPPGTTMADARNGSSYNQSNPLIMIAIIFNGGGGIEFTASKLDFTVEFEIAGSITQTQPAVADGSQEIGFNLDLFADVDGAVTLGDVTAHTNFDEIDQTNNDWVGVNCTLSDLPTPFGVSSTGSGTGTVRTLALLSMNPAIDLTGKRMLFEYWMNAGTLDAMVSGAGADSGLKILLLSSAGNRTEWGWPKSVLYGDSTWHEFVLDLTGSDINIIETDGTLDVSNIIQINVQWIMGVSTDAGFFRIRRLRSQESTFLDHPVDVAEWLIEENVGLTGAADATTFATAKTNLPSVVLAGDLRNAGANFGEVLARIGAECRTNFVPSESSTGTVFKAFNALSTYAFPASARTLTEFRGLRTRKKPLDAQPTEFIGLYDFRNQFDPGSIEGFASLIQANTTTNDISADVPTSSITAAQARVGVKQSDPLAYLLLPDLASMVEVFAYIVKEGLRNDADSYTMRVPFASGYDLEPGDILRFTPRWASSPAILVSPISGSASVSNNGTGNNDGMIGYKFRSSSASIINALGIWDGPTETEVKGLGLEESAEVGIWDADTSTLLGSVVIGAGTAGILIDEFRYGEIVDIQLEAGVDYIVGAFYTSGGNAFLQGANAFPPNSGVTGLGSLFNNGGVFSQPQSTFSSDFFFIGPNISVIGGSIKVRLVSTTFSFDEPSVILNLEEVL